MGDWDDMIDMGYGNSDGTLTDKFYESNETNYSDQDVRKYQYIDIELTLVKFLAPDEKYLRLRIENNKESVRWDDFEVLHDKANGDEHSS